MVLQSALNEEVTGRDKDQAAAAADLAQQLSGKDKELQAAAQQLSLIHI